MPELPEVETIRRDLEERIKDKKISKTEVKDPKAIQGGTSLESVHEKEVKRVSRRGKLLILELEEENSILVHLKMTGQLIYCKGKEMIAGGHTFDKDDPVEDVGGELPNKHTRVIFYFQTGEKLFFNDMRRFGYIRVVSTEEKEGKFQELGPEPLSSEFDADTFQDNLKKRKIAIKKALLDQKLVAGVGNIYADEALFEAGILPNRPASDLTSEEADKLHNAVQKVLKKSIKYRGTTFNNYVDSQGKQGNFSQRLQVYGREGEKCSCCRKKIKKTVLGGRGTHYCPFCQK